MIERIINRALAGLQYLLTVAVSVVVIVIAVVAFRPVLDEPDETGTTTTATTATTASPSLLPGSPAATPATAASRFDCARAPLRGDDRSRVVRLFYACGAPGSPPGGTWVYRQIDAEGGVLPLTMQALVAGPTPDERSDGFRSLFSPATADAVLSVSRTEGAVIVDLRDLGPMPSLASIPEGPEFLATLNNTIFQHDIVSSIEYRIEGSCERFWEYFDEDGCPIVRREAWEQDPGAAS